MTSHVGYPSNFLKRETDSALDEAKHRIHWVQLVEMFKKEFCFIFHLFRLDECKNVLPNGIKTDKIESVRLYEKGEYSKNCSIFEIYWSLGIILWNADFCGVITDLIVNCILVRLNWFFLMVRRETFAELGLQMPREVRLF